MANELDEVSGPVNPNGNPVGNPALNNANSQPSFGDKRTSSQFTPVTDIMKKNPDATKAVLPSIQNEAKAVIAKTATKGAKPPKRGLFRRK